MSSEQERSPEKDAGGIPWATWPWSRCPARREDYARCDLRKGHGGDHLLERGIGGNWSWSTQYITPERVTPCTCGPNGACDRCPPEVCSTCGGSFDSPACSLNRDIRWSGHTREGGVWAAPGD